VITTLLLAQATHPDELETAWRMVVEGTPSTKLILVILAVFSLGSWAVILWKALLFRRLKKLALAFDHEMQRADRLEEAYRGVLSLPESPFTRVFRSGVNFFSELRPGALSSTGGSPAFSAVQLEALRLVLEKEEGQERDELSHGLSWLAIIATASPLMGLLGTVIGVMNSFVGVATSGSSSIGAVAPGIAEALIATAAGLVAAIPAAMGYNYLAAKLQLFMGQLEGFSSEFIGTLAREGKI
jgi:biopolymer transport protein TolQ